MMNRASAGQFPPPLSPPPPPPPQEFDVNPEAMENEAWEEVALADTIEVFDAATVEEARRHRAEEMGERSRAERELLHRERREALEQRLPEEAAVAEAAWAAEADALAAEAAAQQRALVESFESQKKLQDDARAREDEQIRHAVELSLQAAQEGRAGDDALIVHQRLLVTLRRERRRAAQELRRRGGYDGAGPSNAPPGGQ
nr:uncharacterized protein LOC127303177 [Lolium perenne]